MSESVASSFNASASSTHVNLGTAFAETVFVDELMNVTVTTKRHHATIRTWVGRRPRHQRNTSPALCCEV
jgi:hypothetical protein